MAPNKSKPSPASAAPSDSRKAIDALWLFEQFMHCDPPVILNVAGIAEATGMKPNTIVKRINTMQHRYPGFGIVTRTIGPKQSSNLAVASPKVAVNPPAKRPTSKGAHGEARDKNAESDEEADKEEDSRRKTRASSRADKDEVRVEGEIEARKPRRQSRASTVDNTASSRKTTKPSKAPHEIMLAKTKAIQKPVTKLVDVVEGEKSESEAEDNPSRREAPTPKTRGGRKSAGLGDIRNALLYPKIPVLRSRHESSKKDDDLKPEDRVSDQISGVFDEHGSRKAPAPLNLNTKRKRSASPDSSSSPLTPLLAIRRRLDEKQDPLENMEEVTKSNKSESPDTCPPKKKTKPSDSSSPDVSMKDDLAATQQDFDVTFIMEEGLGLAGTKNVQPHHSVVGVPFPQISPTSAAQHQDMAHEDITKSSETSADETSMAGVTATGDRDPEDGDDQGTRLAGNHSFSKERSTPENIRAKEVDLGPIRDQAAGTKPEELVEIEAKEDTGTSATHQEGTFRNLMASHVEADGSSKLPNYSHCRESEESKQPKKSSIFSRPLEWMVWNPATKPGKTTKAP